MPLFVPIAVGVVTLATGAVVYVAKGSRDEIEEIPENLYNRLVDEGTPIFDSLGDNLNEGLTYLGSEIGELGADLGTGLIGLGSEIAEELGDLGQDIGLGALKVIKGAGVALLEGAEDVVDYTWGKVSPHRVEAVTALTAIMIYVTTTVIIFKKIRGAS